MCFDVEAMMPDSCMPHVQKKSMFPESEVTPAKFCDFLQIGDFIQCHTMTVPTSISILHVINA